MSERDLEDYLQDILDTIAAIEQFTENIEFAAFSNNLEKVLQCLEHSRSLGKLSSEFLNQ